MVHATLKSPPVVEGQIIDINITSMAYDNSAIGRYKDFVVMVDRGAPDDELKVKITSLRRDYARAKIESIEKSNSLFRTEPPCKLFKVCGGCQWQHLKYEKQLEEKNILLNRFFSKLNLDNGVLKHIIPAENIWHYRNKVQYPVRTIDDTKRLKAGYYSWHSNDLINILYCPIQNELFDRVVETVRQLAPKYKILAWDGKKKTGWLRHICVRANFDTSEALLTLVAVNENLSCAQDFAKEIMDTHKELVGVCININTKSTNVIYGDKTKVIKGRGYIFEELNNLKFKISATSFFQVNSHEAIKMMNIIKDYASLSGDEVVLDAFCGVGLFTLSLAKNARKVIGVEEIKQSIEDGISSAKENNIKNATFIFGKVENKINEIVENEKPIVVILDPPRVGCNARILESIGNSLVKKIIYVSCNPATLARDLGILNSLSYQIKSIQPIDIFPHTYHTECIVLLEKN